MNERTNLQDLEKAQKHGDLEARGRLLGSLREFSLCVARNCADKMDLPGAEIGEVVGEGAALGLACVAKAISSNVFVHKSDPRPLPGKRKGRLRTFAFVVVSNAVRDVARMERRRLRHERLFTADEIENGFAEAIADPRLTAEEGDATEYLAWSLAALQIAVKSFSTAAAESGDPVLLRSYQVLQLRAESSHDFRRIADDLELEESTARGYFFKAKCEVLRRAVRFLRKVGQIDDPATEAFVKRAFGCIFAPTTDGEPQDGGGLGGSLPSAAQVLVDHFFNDREPPVADDEACGEVLTKILQQVYRMLNDESYEVASRFALMAESSYTSV